jgi:hypothetical protein
VERLAKRLLSQPWSALAALERVLSHQSLSERDGEVLADLVRVRDADSAEQRGSREIFFELIRNAVESSGV